MKGKLKFSVKMSDTKSDNNFNRTIRSIKINCMREYMCLKMNGK